MKTLGMLFAGLVLLSVSLALADRPVRSAMGVATANRPVALPDPAPLGESQAIQPAMTNLSPRDLHYLAHFPAPEEGMSRFVLKLEPIDNEHLVRVELIAGKIIETDGVNSYVFRARQINIQQIGRDLTGYVVPKNAFNGGTEVTEAFGEFKYALRFAPLITDEPCLTRYNSNRLIVVYVPEGGEVKYRLWRADRQRLPLHEH